MQTLSIFIQSFGLIIYSVFLIALLQLIGISLTDLVKMYIQLFKQTKTK